MRHAAAIERRHFRYYAYAFSPLLLLMLSEFRRWPMLLFFDAPARRRFRRQRHYC